MENLTHLPKLPSIGSIRKLPPNAKREFRNGMGFLSPWIIGFLAFTFLPTIATLIFTFLNLKITDGLFSPLKFVGLDNWITLAKDNTIWNARPNSSPGALWITIRFGLLALPVGILVPLGIAVLMNSPHLKARNIFRTLFYMPYIIPFVASVFLWAGVLNPETGWINQILVALGVPKGSLPGWANDIHWVYPAYILFGIWGIGNAFLTMLAGIQGVPTELYDAAKVDGAGGFASFWNVTFPMISPVIFYNLILSVVGLFQYFLVPLAFNLGTGDPGGATMFLNLKIYKTFFLFQNMSYGSTLAWMLFLVILIVTIVLFSTARYWVYYASERSN
ncbi:MAG: sugar ABC transporter permease [Anaerolineales bacterium]|jgi:multiple sugar transport system permease protein